ncbi:hypothetical protein NADFUDRAFT_50550 [Nadsonia fulvescens var. elongata DSM 6958]|uniref:Uncharacterized protein n=1 Tax=Nadsonia fulvescens var. elongata DSM 6958 TaxID=857566 RepID=A0A1E3PMI3_9ASCO|nr:hypothetical protein NADFUDRAFT_50550 [Nadsonia fulvescens var. elongata DSM 6958]
MVKEEKAIEETQAKPNPLQFVWFAATLSYSLSLFQKYGGQIPSFYILLTAGGFHALLEANMWLFSTASLFKVIPFFIMAMLHIASFIQTDLMPNSSISNRIDAGLKQNETFIELVLAESKLVVFLRLIFDVILMRMSAGVMLIIYGIIFKIRIQYVPSTYASIMRLGSRIDALAENPKCPAKAKDIWAKIKEGIHNSQSSNLVSEESNKELESNANKISQIPLRGNAKKIDNAEKKTQ